MLIKQTAGIQIVIGGDKPEITNLYLSSWNWKGLNTDVELLELSDDFSYFFVNNLKQFIKARATAFAENWRNYWPESHKSGGVWELALQKAKDEFEAIKYEKFLPESYEYCKIYSKGFLEKEFNPIPFVSKKLLKAFGEID